MYNLKTQVRGNYSNYKICHGSFNTEEAREVLSQLNLLHYWIKNRPVFASLNNLFDELNRTNVQYVVERSFKANDFKKLLDTSGGDIDVITDNYYKFKGIVGGINTHKHRKENLTPPVYTLCAKRHVPQVRKQTNNCSYTISERPHV